MPPRTAVLWLILAATAVRLAFACSIGLGIDESYVVAAGRQFHLGYFDHPPAVWWLSQAAARLAGSDAAWVVRLPFIALFALSTWLMFRLAATLFDERAGLWAALALSLSPVLGVTSGSWVLPDGPLVCALLGAACCLVRALPGRGWGWWLGTGLCAGLAMLSKYNAALVLAGAAVALATVARPWLARPQPYVAAMLALAVFAPELVWNAQHHWASFAFQGSRAEARAFHPLGPLAVLGGEALFLLPWIWLGLVLELVRGVRAGPVAWRSWLLCCLAAGPILLFALVAFWSGRVLYHWAAPGYLFLFPLLGARLAEWRPARRWAAGTAVLVLVGLCAIGAELRWNWIAPFAGGADPAVQALDWRPLRQALAARGLPGDAVLAGPDWSTTGKLGIALGPVLCLDTDDREFGYGRTPADIIGRNVLIVAPRLPPEQYRALFADVAPLPPVALVLPGRTVSIGLYLGRDLRHWP